MYYGFVDGPLTEKNVKVLKLICLNPTQLARFDTQTVNNRGVKERWFVNQTHKRTAETFNLHTISTGLDQILNFKKYHFRNECNHELGILLL